MACGHPHLIRISALPFQALLLGLEGWRSLHCATNQSPRLLQGTATLFRHMESSNQFAPKWITWKPTWMDLIWRHSRNQRKARSAKTLLWSFGRYSERMDPDSSAFTCQMHASPIAQLRHPLQCPWSFSLINIIAGLGNDVYLKFSWLDSMWVVERVTRQDQAKPVYASSRREISNFTRGNHF